MFDDQLPTQPAKGHIPDNLPIAEPEDMFAEPAPGEVMPSAVAAGALKPKVSAPAPTSEAPLRPRVTVPPVVGKTGQEHEPDIDVSSYPQYKIQEPSLGRNILIAVVALALVAGLFWGGWWVYAKFFPRRAATPTVTTPAVTEPVVTPSSNNTTVDDSVLFGDVADTDGDGLDDIREKDLRTDPNNVDTDGDGLTDYDEVSVWKTDPNKKDSDGDAYDDGVEVKNGYNPSGPGRIFTPPATSETSEAAVSSSLSVSTPKGPSLMPSATCGENIDCFIDKTKTCTEASVKLTTIIDLRGSLGVKETVYNHLALQGQTPQGQCRFFIHTEDILNEFAPTVPEITRQEEDARAADLVGREGTCLMATGKLGDLMIRWKAGDHADEDFDASTCVGTFFEKRVF